jgi:hypothetical protein
MHFCLVDHVVFRKCSVAILAFEPGATRMQQEPVVRRDHQSTYIL